MLLFILFPLAFAVYDDCVPFSPRVQLGDYYSDKNKEKIIIFFNTKQACEGAFLSLSGRRIPVQSIYHLDMSEEYEGDNKYKTYIHKVVLKEISLGEIYEYVIYGEDDQYSELYQFKVPHKVVQDVTRLVIVGNMDVSVHSQPTFVWFEAMKQFKSQFDAIIYPGSMAINLEDEDCRKGETFLREFSEISGTWPLMVVPGWSELGISKLGTFFYNHFQESHAIKHYDLGMIRVYQMDLLNYYKGQDIDETIDYIRLTQKQLSSHIKWSILFTNVPLFCFVKNDQKCQKLEEMYLKERLKFSGIHMVFDSYYGLYARTQFQSGKDNKIYYYQGSPVLISNGVGGSEQFQQETEYQIPAESKSIYTSQSVGVLTAVNETHLHFQQVSTTENIVVDEVYILKGEPIVEQRLNIQIMLIIIAILLMVAALLIYGRSKIGWPFVKQKQVENQLVGENELSQFR